MAKGQLAASREARCPACSMGAVSVAGWTPMPWKSEPGKVAKASVAVVDCKRNGCLVEYNIITVVERRSKEFKTAPLPKGKTVLTPQGPLDIKPVDVSEAQVKELFDETTKTNTSLKEKIVAALRQANKDFREVDSGPRQHLMDNARRVIKSLAKELPVDRKSVV